MDFVNGFIAMLRTRATEREREGASTAQAFSVVAAELEEAYHRHLTEPLTIEQAQQESGYSAAQLRRLQRRGVPLTRQSLPRKARPPRPERVRSVRTLADDVIAARTRTTIGSRAHA